MEKHIQPLTLAITDRLGQLVRRAVETLGFEYSEPVHLEHPDQVQHGDFSTNVAMKLFSQRSQISALEGFTSPRQLAEAIVGALSAQEDDLVTKVEVAGPGFINLFLAPQFYFQALQEIVAHKQPVFSKVLAGQSVVVEYSSPNIAKPFTIGHLRSTIIGDAVANILEASGAIVYRDNHLGDWGTQFGKQIYALLHLGEGSLEKNLAKIEASDRPVKELVNLYVEFHAKAEEDPTLEDEGRSWFTKLENGDALARELWQKCIDLSWKEFAQIYADLGVHFTENGGRGFGESYFENKMAGVIEELETKGLLKESQGAKIIEFPEEEKLPLLMVVKKDGSTLYATRDLATDRFRLFEQYSPDVIIINEVGAEQSLYFQQLYRVEELLGWVKSGQRVHVKHGLYRFKDKKMSTRKGNVIWLEDVLREAREKAAELSRLEGEQKTLSSQAIGIGALKWNDLKRSSVLDVVFDWDELLAMQGNSGPYIQYTYARCQSVLTQAGVLPEIVPQVAMNEFEQAVIQQLSQFHEALQRSAQEYAPHHLCTYLYELCQRFNSFYNQNLILVGETDPALQDFRLAVVQSVAVTLKSGLDLLSIQTVDRM